MTVGVGVSDVVDSDLGDAQVCGDVGARFEGGRMSE